MDIANLKVTISCGCEVYKANVQRKPKGEAAKNTVYSRYKQNAKKRNISFGLNLEQCEVFFKGNCHYCGAEPSNVSKSKESGDYIYSGIDRVDSKQGYFVDNCVSCCWRCNSAKKDMRQEEFISWIGSVLSNWSKDKVNQQFDLNLINKKFRVNKNK